MGVIFVFDSINEAREHLRQAQDDIFALSIPLREERDALVRSEKEDEAEKLTARIKDVEAGLFGIQNALGVLNIAMGGKSIKVEAAETRLEFKI